MAKCRKCKPTECEECPEWIFTLADLIMCMMGLFVILWVLKPTGNPPQGNAQDNKPYIKMAAAIRDAFGYVPNPNSLDPVDIELRQQKLKGDRVPLGPGEGGKTQLEDQSTDGQDREVTKIRDGEVSTVGTALLFGPGSAETTAEMKKQIVALAENVRGHRQIIYIKGHASLDDLPEGATDAEFMHLSVQRATAIREMLRAQNVDGVTLRITGCSTAEPSKQRRFGADGQRLNRRVEIDVTDELVEDRQDNRARPKVSGP